MQANPSECKVTMSAAEAVSAEFAPIPQQTLSVTKTGSGQGTVTSTPAGISCPGTCSAQFDEGSTVYLTAAPAPTSTFAGFTGGGCSGTPICAVTMSQAQSVSAEFGLGGPGASAAASAARLSLGKLSVRGASATLELSLPAPAACSPPAP